MFWITEELHMCTPLQIIATFVNNQTRQMKKKKLPLKLLNVASQCKRKYMFLLDLINLAAFLYLLI